MRPVGAHEGRDLYAVDDGIKTGIGAGLGANRVDAGVRTPTTGQVLNALVNVLLHEVEHLGAGSFGHGHTIRDGFDGDDATSTQEEGAADGKLADWPAAPYRDRVAVLDVAELGPHVA